MEICIKIALGCFIAFLIALISTPIVIKIAPLIKAVDTPKDDRRMHTKPMPLCGGLAIFIAFSVTSFIFSELTPTFWGIWIGALILIVTGVLDDIFSLHAYLKFALQFVAAIIPVCLCLVTEQINIFGNQINLGIVAYPLTVIWIVALTNAYNLIDGLDGLACGVSSISAISLFFVALFFKNTEIMIFSALIFGSTLGFLPYNFNPAKIFMGDTGAMFLGYILGAVSVLGVYQAPSKISVAVPFLICGFPIFDTTFAFTRRILSGKSPFYADRGHSHHKLIDRGFSHRDAVLFLYAVSLVLGIIAVSASISTVLIRIIMTSVIIVAVIIFITVLKIKKGKKAE